MVATDGADQQQPVVADAGPADVVTPAETFGRKDQEVISRGGGSRGGGSRGGAIVGVRSGGGSVEGSANDNLEDEAAVGSIHHILKTAFKELYGGGADEKEEEKEQPSAAEVAGKRQGVSAGASGITAAGNRTEGETKGKRKSTEVEAAEGTTEDGDPGGVNGVNSVEGTGGNDPPESTEMEGVQQATVGEETLSEFTDGLSVARQGGHTVVEGGTSEDAAAIEERFDSIDTALGDRQALAKGLKSYTLGQRVQAQEHDREAIESLKKQGIIVGAHIPMGPSGLVLDRSAIDAFGRFAVSLLDAAELARANREASLRHSGNLPWDQFAKKEPQGEGGDARFEPPGYLKHTATNSTREGLALKRSFGRRGDKGIQQQQRLRLEAERALEGSQALATDAVYPDEEGAGTAAGVWRDQGITEDDTTDDDSADGGGAKPEQGRRKVVPKAAQRDADAAVMTRMRRKLCFRRNPRCDPESRWHEQMLTEKPATPATTGTAHQATAHSKLASKTVRKTRTLNKTDLLTSWPRKGALEGENGYFLATPAVVEYFDYWVGRTFRAELVLRNISCLKRGFMLLPPATEHFSLAKAIYPSSEIEPESGVVTGSGELAPGVGAKVLVDFTPDSLGEYHDTISVVTEVGTFEVPIFAHRRRPCLSLPPSGLLDCGGCLLGESKTRCFRVKNTGGLVRFRLFPVKAAAAISPGGTEPLQEEDRAEGMAGYVSGGCSVSTDPGCDGLSSEGGGSLRIDTDEVETASRQDAGDVGGAGVRAVDFDNPDFDPEGKNGRLEDGPFCVFPTDFSIGEGETAFVNVEYLPSKVGLHEARFAMVQDNCEERELRVSALCEQDPEQQKQLSQSGGFSGMDEVTPLPAVVNHLLFEPTLLSSTGRRRFTLRNDTTGDLPVRWEISEILPLTKTHQRPPKGSGRGFAPTQAAAGSPVLPSGSSLTTITASVGLAAGVALCGGSSGRGHGAGKETSRQEEPGSLKAATSTLRNADGRDDKRAGVDFSSASRSPATSSLSPSSSVVGATVVLPLPSDEKATAVGRAPDCGPFGIFPESAVVPAHGEFSFEVAFSPAGLGESRFQAVAVVEGVPAAALAYHNPTGSLADGANIASSGEAAPDFSQACAADGGTADKQAGDSSKSAGVEGCCGANGHGGGVVGGISSRFRLFLRSLDLEGKGCFSREAAIEGLRAIVPVLQEASAAYGNSSPSPSEEFNQIPTLVDEAACRLEPNEDASGRGGGFTEDAFVSVGGAISAIGVELRERISHALAGKSLEEVMGPHRKDMSALQVELRGSGEPARLSLRPAMLQAPGDHLPYGQPYVLEMEVCNASETPAEFEFDLSKLTVSPWGNDPLGDPTCQADGGGRGGGCTSCDVQVSPAKAVAPPSGSVQCTVTLTPFCVGSRTVSIPIIAPTAAPPELGEEFCLRIGFVGSGAAARIEAAEVDLGLIAVGTAQSGEIKLRNFGTVPLAFAMVQALTAAGTVAEAAAEESRTVSMLRDLLLSQQQQQQQQKQQQQRQQEQQKSQGNQRHSQQVPQSPFAATTTTTGAAQQHIGDGGGSGNDQALARVFGTSAPPPPPPADVSGPTTEHASTRNLLQRRNSEGSVGSADSFSVSRDSCRLSFEPALGELAPGRSATITVTCEGGKLPERYRTAARALLQSCDWRGVSFGSEYVAVRAEIQEPTVYISPVEVDVGIAYLGVPLTRRVKMVNLSNLEVRDVELRYTARRAGPIDEVYACRVFGMALPLGFAFSGKNRGPTLSFGLVGDGEAAPRPLQRPHLPQYVGEEPLPEPEPAPPLEFGKVGLRGRKTITVFVRNLSAISTPFAVKVRKYSCTPCPPRLKISNMSYSALQRVVSNPRALRGYLDEDKGGGSGNPHGSKPEESGRHGRTRHPGPGEIGKDDVCSANRSPSAGRPAPWSSSRGGGGGGGGGGDGSGSVRKDKQKLVLGVDHEATEAFFSKDGRARTKAQIDQREDCFVLKEGLGAAFLVEPASGTLPPWGVATVSVTVFNDTPGRYTDKADITFSGAPMASLPIKVVVEGSPLSLKREALGLDLSGPEPLLSFGQVFVHGGKTFRVIKIKNEGTLPAMLSWSLQDANVDAKEAAKKVDVFIKLVESSDGSGGWAADVSVSYRQPKPFESPFVVRPRQGVVEPRSDGAFKVVLPEHREGEMAARLVADAYWMPPSGPGDDSSSMGGNSAVGDSDSALSGQRVPKANPKDTGCGGGDLPRTVGMSPHTGEGPGGGGGAAAMSPLSQGGGSPHPDLAGTAIATAMNSDPAEKNTTSKSTSAFQLGTDGNENKTAPHHATDPPDPPHEIVSVSTMSSSSLSTIAHTAATPKGGDWARGPGGSVGVAGGPPGGSESGTSSTASLAAAATVHIAAKTLVGNTINRKHGRTTSCAVVLKAAAWGIEPRLALDKKTHAALQQECAGAGASAGERGGNGGNRGGGRQFLKFEAWSTRASASSSPWAAHPALRRQISLSNPLTIPVSFRVDTHGPFAINPTPSKKRLHKGRGNDQRCFDTSGGIDSQRREGSNRGPPGDGGRSPKRRRAGGGDTTVSSGVTGTPAAATALPTRRSANKHQRQEGQEVVLLPEQNLQLELVFMPSRSPEMTESLVSSFSPGTEDIPKLVFRTTGELRIAFSTGHVQTVLLRGEVLRPMITVAPPTHTFGTIHTERHGLATLFLGNPTFADAEWSLTHVPVPPPKQRASHNYNRNATTVASSSAAASDVRKGVGAGKGWPTGTSGRLGAVAGAEAARGALRASPGKPGGRGTPAESSPSIRGAPRGRLREGTPSDLGKGFKSLVVDDPSVFVFGENFGVIAGVKLPLKSSAACLPEDWNRLERACWPEQPTRVTWGGVVDCCSVLYEQPSTGTDASRHRHRHRHPPIQRLVRSRSQDNPETLPAGIVMWRDQPHGQRQVVGSTLKLEPFLTRKEGTKQGYRTPRALEVKFFPKRNVFYRSRFRLTVRGGEGAEIVLEGFGTYREDTRPGKLPKV
eukprot:g10416.t1